MVLRAAVLEAAIDEHRRAASREDDVTAPSLVDDQRMIDAEPIARFVQAPPDQELRDGVRRLFAIIVARAAGLDAHEPSDLPTTDCTSSSGIPDPQPRRRSSPIASHNRQGPGARRTPSGA